MFCMNCGQALPEGAKFCSKCGTPQGVASPIGLSSAESENTNDASTFKPAMCPNCNAHMKVDPSCMLARCDACGTECLVQDAIKALSSVTVKQDIQVGNATFNVSSTNTDALLKRVEIMLADGDFDGAMSKCDTILDSDPTNGKVYFYMLMSNLKCRNKNDLAAQKDPFNGNQYYLKAMQYGDPELNNELQQYISIINTRNDIIRKREEEEINAKLKNLKIGDKFYFGTNNGQRIWWKVLSIRDRMAFIISSNIICKMSYHQPGGNNTWDDCTLRKWLNNEFINGYFTPAEQARILPCKLNNDKNPRYNTPGGVPSTDKVFLLSINEANQLFSNRHTRATGSLWWLRSPGHSHPDCAAYVDIGGVVNARGDIVKSNYGVRPALWLKLD